MKAKYSGTQIWNTESLALALGLSAASLKGVANSASQHYFDFEVDKKDGTKRKVSGPQQGLKTIQRRINHQFFEKVNYPNYLYGGLRGRDYVQNALVHSGAKSIIALDIKDFFSNITRQQVFNLFKYFFNFSEPVSTILSDICTKDGKVPQGACTSTYISNLVFYEYEPRLVHALMNEGLLYSRLIDDITISSKTEISKKQSSKIIERVTAMLHTLGFKLKHKKTKITSASNPENLMEVTGLWLNRGKPRIKRTERSDIRAEFRKCIQVAKIDKFDPEYHALHERVSGRIAKLQQLSHFEAEIYRKQIRKVLPLYNLLDMRRTRGMVASISKSTDSQRASPSYIERYYKIIYRINIIARSDPKQAHQLRLKMQKCTPKINRRDILHGSIV